MSTIQSLKNFIRHGKQARLVTPHAEPTTNVSPIHAQQQRQPQQPSSAAGNLDALESKLGNGQGAGGAAASPQKSPDAHGKRSREVEIEKIVAEERQSSAQMPKYPGLERWVLLEKMGDGAFSNVYRAKDATGQYDQVAIKVVRKFEMNSSQRANILKEVQIMRQIDHPNIVKLVDFSEARQYYYIVLELCPGGELFHQIVRLTYFSEDLSRHIILQVAKAIEYLHETSGVVHRKHPKPTQPGDEEKVDEGEFTPGVGSGGIGTIKIADFGLSKVIWDSSTMTPCGTVGYTAPEIVKDERYSKSVDMWALGCVLYTLLCGFPPFYDESIQALTEKVARGQYTFLSPWWDDISKSAQDLISHLLTVDPEKRYSINEFLNHPWIRESDEATEGAADAPPVASRLAQQHADPETPYTPLDRPLDFRSPGAINLREVFDVGYAVRRQEEETKRRRHNPTARFQTALNPLNEDSDSEQEEPVTYQPIDNPPPKVHKTSQQAKEMAAMEVKLRSTNLDAHANPAAYKPQYPRHNVGQQPKAAPTPIPKKTGRSSRQPFELSLDKATLLEKRGKREQAA